MKSVFLFLSMVGFSSISHAQFQLPWTNSSESVQAIVYEALSGFKQSSHVKNGVGAELIVEHQGVKVSCNAEARGTTAVQNYTCTFSDTELDWTNSASSVQAVLWKALSKLKKDDECSQNPQNLVKAGPNGQLIVTDAYYRLLCQTASLEGAVTVQSYRCSLLVKAD